MTLAIKAMPKCLGCHGCRHRRALQARAATTVMLTLRPARRLRCTDCGGRATYYDHRDYRKPLTVAPVCPMCNWWRGPARPVPHCLRPWAGQHARRRSIRARWAVEQGLVKRRNGRRGRAA